MTAALYHYTCFHTMDALKVDQSGLAVLRARPPLSPLLWLTDMEVPAAAPLGLTRVYLDCDRTAYRFLIPDPVDVDWWPHVRREYDRDWVAGLEAAPGAMPAHWYVTTTPQAARLAPVRGHALTHRQGAGQ